MLEQFDKSRGIQLLIGIFGIYTCYWSAGYLQQKILKTPYKKRLTDEQVVFQSPITLVWIQATVAWILGSILNKNLIKSPNKIPKRNIIACALMITVSTFTGLLAIKMTSFPIVMMIKSCSIIPVVLVGIFCSKVTDHSLKLGAQKIIVAIFITLGILIYNFGGDKDHKQNATNIIGVLLLLISLVADGFLPDFQAAIKSEYNPSPIQMFEQTNKWITVISLLYASSTGQISYLLNFTFSSPACVLDIFIYSILTAIGQIFVYRMIKQFKQHIVPFVITTRKIFTVVISIIFYHHPTTLIQIIGIFIVFVSASFEYVSQIFWQKPSTVVSPDVSIKIQMGQKFQNLTDEIQTSSRQKLEQI